MGEMADLTLEAAEGEYFARCDTLLSLMALPDEQLRRMTASARDPKIRSIRSWKGPLSEKQRWCLVFWIEGHEL